MIWSTHLFIFFFPNHLSSKVMVHSCLTRWPKNPWACNDSEWPGFLPNARKGGIFLEIYLLGFQFGQNICLAMFLMLYGLSNQVTFFLAKQVFKQSVCQKRL
uniref:Uncharacterized protein n=1 Tax=Rhizophora mucronata TaxID=61149 RepID=A0A2P2MK40_RHIMU